jgi:Type I restriction-modification system methyltransferase subunit
MFVKLRNELGCVDMSENNILIDRSIEEMEVIPPGKLKCYITDKLRKNTPEERVRQDVARGLVEIYGYNRSDIDIEFSIKYGSGRKRLDIVIFNNEKEHEQKNIYTIIEVKPDKIKPSNKKEGIAQLESYVSACLNCSFALWVGNERLTFKVVGNDGEKELIKIPDIPKNGETGIPKQKRDNLAPALNLKQVFKRIHNYITANQGLRKDTAFEELQKLIFIKVYDEQYNEELKFYILPDEDPQEVRQRLTEVFKNVQKHYKYIFKGNETIELNDIVLSYIVSELQRFSLVDTDTDVKGEAYEQIVGSNLRGDRGEFFTPRTVCDMTVEMLVALIGEDKLRKPGAFKILDPAVGTGGFLIAMVHKIKEIFSKQYTKPDQIRDLVKDVANSNLFGSDFTQFLVKVAQMNMVMHGDGSSNIVNNNSLENPAKWNDDTIKLGEFDLVITNPPFGTKIRVDDPEILEQYELTKFDANNPRNSLPPEQLFIERCLDFLKPGGYLGIVLPDSILSNPGLEWLRKWIIKKTYIFASIDLPVETFQPHTGTQTSILILKKKTPEQEKYKEDYEIFMAIPEKVGHDRRGNPIYRTNIEGKIELDSNNRQIIDDQLPIVAEMFKKWIKEKGIK